MPRAKRIQRKKHRNASLRPQRIERKKKRNASLRSQRIAGVSVTAGEWQYVHYPDGRRVKEFVYQGTGSLKEVYFWQSKLDDQWYFEDPLHDGKTSSIICAGSPKKLMKKLSQRQFWWLDNDEDVVVTRHSDGSKSYEYEGLTDPDEITAGIDKETEKTRKDTAEPSIWKGLALAAMTLIGGMPGMQTLARDTVSTPEPAQPEPQPDSTAAALHLLNNASSVPNEPADKPNTASESFFDYDYYSNLGFSGLQLTSKVLAAATAVKSGVVAAPLALMAMLMNTKVAEGYMVRVKTDNDNSPEASAPEENFAKPVTDTGVVSTSQTTPDSNSQFLGSQFLGMSSGLPQLSEREKWGIGLGVTAAAGLAAAGTAKYFGVWPFNDDSSYGHNEVEPSAESDMTDIDDWLMSICTEEWHCPEEYCAETLHENDELLDLEMDGQAEEIKRKCQQISSPNPSPSPSASQRESKRLKTEPQRQSDTSVGDDQQPSQQLALNAPVIPQSQDQQSHNLVMPTAQNPLFCGEPKLHALKMDRFEDGNSELMYQSGKEDASFCLIYRLTDKTAYRRVYFKRIFGGNLEAADKAANKVDNELAEAIIKGDSYTHPGENEFALGYADQPASMYSPDLVLEVDYDSGTAHKLEYNLLWMLGVIEVDKKAVLLSAPTRMNLLRSDGCHELSAYAYELGVLQKVGYRADIENIRNTVNGNERRMVVIAPSPDGYQMPSDKAEIVPTLQDVNTMRFSIYKLLYIDIYNYSNLLATCLQQSLSKLVESDRPMKKQPADCQAEMKSLKEALDSRGNKFLQATKTAFTLATKEDMDDMILALVVNTIAPTWNSGKILESCNVELMHRDVRYNADQVYEYLSPFGLKQPQDNAILEQELGFSFMQKANKLLGGATTMFGHQYGAANGVSEKLQTMKERRRLIKRSVDYGFEKLLTGVISKQLRPLRDAILADDIDYIIHNQEVYLQHFPLDYWFNFACAAGSVNFVRMALNKKIVYILGNTPLCYAASSGNKDLCKLLMEYPESMEKYDEILAFARFSGDKLFFDWMVSLDPEYSYLSTGFSSSPTMEMHKGF